MTTFWWGISLRVYFLIVQFVVWPLAILFGLTSLGLDIALSWTSWFGAFVLSQVVLGMIAVPEFKKMLKELDHD